MNKNNQPVIGLQKNMDSEIIYKYKIGDKIRLQEKTIGVVVNTFNLTMRLVYKTSPTYYIINPITKISTLRPNSSIYHENQLENLTEMEHILYA